MARSRSATIPSLAAASLAGVVFASLSTPVLAQGAAAWTEADCRRQARECEELSLERPNEALAQADAALAAAATAAPSLRARLRLCRGEVLMRCGRADEALTEFAAVDGVTVDDAGFQARLQVRIGGALVTQARIEDAMRHLAAAESLLKKHPDAETEAVLLGVQGVVLQTQSRFDAALAKYCEARNRVADLGRDHLDAQWLYNIATVQVATGDRSGAGVTLAAARAKAKGGHQLAMILGLQADLLSGDARSDERRVLLQQALDLERGIGSRSGEALFHRRLGALAVHSSDDVAAVAHFTRSLELSRTIGNAESTASSLVALADVHASRGDMEKAIELGEEALRTCADLRMPVVERHVAGSLALAHEAVGNFARALELQKRSASCAERVAEESRTREVSRIRAGFDAELVASRFQAELAEQALLRNAALAAAFAAMVVLAFVVRVLRQKARLTRELSVALEDVRRLSGLLPICMHCKSIREGDGRWQRLEDYVSSHSEASFTHGICPHCMQQHYPTADG